MTFSRHFKGLSGISGMVVLAALAGGCAVTEGSGVGTTEEREVGAFDRIDTRGVNARIAVDPAAPPAGSLQVSGDDNLVSLVKTHVEDGRLVIELRDDRDVDPVVGLEVVVSVPRLVRLNAERSASVDVTIASAETLGVGAFSSAKVVARGSVGLLDIEMSGSAEMRSRHLVALDVQLRASGSSRAWVCATNTLDVELGGSSDAEYSCDPAKVTREVGGNSELRSR